MKRHSWISWSHELTIAIKTSSYGRIRADNIIRGFYEGEISFYSKEIMMAWLWPTLWWTAFVLALSLIMICLNVIVRKQWTEHEKLAYPIIQLPLAITEGGGTSQFFQNRLLWIGFGAAALLDIMNGLRSGTLPSSIPGEVPSIEELPSGCPFHPRCPRAESICRTQAAPVIQLPHRQAACHMLQK